jgi:threonine synthase
VIGDPFALRDLASAGWRLACPICGRQARPDAAARRCRACGVSLELHTDGAGGGADRSAPALLDRHRDLLPPMPGAGAGAARPGQARGAADPAARPLRGALTLGEGGTPLLASVALGPLLGLRKLAFKLEGANPTGSPIDRGVVLCVARARAAGARRLAVAAHEGLASSVARYGARAGLGVTVVAAAEDAAGPEARLAVRAGARLVVARAGRRGLGPALRRAAGRTGVALVEPDAPLVAAGLRTLAFELAACPFSRDTGRHDGEPSLRDRRPVGAPADAEGPTGLVLVAGRPPGAGLSALDLLGPALGAGFRVLERARRGPPAPRVLQVGIAATSGVDGPPDRRAVDAAVRLLAEDEGIFASPASAVALAGLVGRARAGEIPDPDAPIVVVLADERASRDAAPADDPQRVGRVLAGVELADLAAALDRPAY